MLPVYGVCHYIHKYMKIKAIRSRWVLDSRGEPTVEVDVTLSSGAFGRASVPSGMSVGKAEAHELRDSGKQFNGKGVSKALNAIEHRISPVLIGMDASDQEAIDAQLCRLDGTINKHRLGSNSLLAVSMATAKAAAQNHNMPFYRYIAKLADSKHLGIPMPMVNIINGGVHADHSSDIQEFMVIPHKATDIHSAIRISTEIYHALGVVFKHRNMPVSIGDEGGYVMHGCKDNSLGIDLIQKAVIDAGYVFGEDIVLGLDMAASHLFRVGRYHMAAEHREIGARGLRDWYANLLESYPIVSIEDPFDEESWADWQLFTGLHGDSIYVVADDLTATNQRRLHRAINKHAANTLLIKPNQIGTLTETIHATKMAQSAGWRTIMSHRSGDTEDTAIAHLAVGLGVDAIKIGSVARGEHTAKYNELLRISESLGSNQIRRVPGTS